MNSANCFTMSFGPVFIAFSSSLSLDFSVLTSSVMLSTDNLKFNKEQCQLFNASTGASLLRSFFNLWHLWLDYRPMFREMTPRLLPSSWAEGTRSDPRERQESSFIKAAKCKIQTPSTCRATLFRCKFWVDASRFLRCVINLSGLKKVFAKSRARVSFGFRARLSSNSQLAFYSHQANQPISALHFFNPQQMF